MEQNGKSKFYLKLSFYTILGMLIYVALVLYLFSHDMILRNRANINISIILLVMIAFSFFQNIIIKNKDNNIKLVIALAVLVVIFGATAYSNNIIINKYLEKEAIEIVDGNEYVTKKIGEDTYYYKVYSGYIKATKPGFSISNKVIDDGDYKYEYVTKTIYDNKGQIVEIRTEGDTKEYIKDDK